LSVNFTRKLAVKFYIVKITLSLSVKAVSIYFHLVQYINKLYSFRVM
jgi:hypothetical protein